MSISRRTFIQGLGLAGVASSVGLLGTRLASAAGKAQVVVVGGGFGGATAAKYVRILDPSVSVTLIEPKKQYLTCPASNWVLAGLRGMGSITQGYATLAEEYGVTVVQDEVAEIKPEARTLKLRGGQDLSYDRLIVSPGIDFRWGAIEGYDQAAAELAPHAWQAGAQTEILLKQIQAMEDGGTVVICSPANPFRCPPGPYERAGMIAHYLKSNKPKSKVVILDAKDAFAKQGLFEQGWKEFYGFGTDKAMIEWVSAANDGTVVRVDAKGRVAYTDLGEHKAAVLNVIPPQYAAAVARNAGLADDSGWCPVDAKTFESTLHKGIHVIGDASIASPMPKSAYAANSQAKVAAFAVVAALKGQEPGTPTWVNTCYSLIAPKYGISVAMVYDYTAEGKIGEVAGAGGVTPKDGNFKKEAAYAESWYDNIINDTFGA